MEDSLTEENKKIFLEEIGIYDALKRVLMWLKWAVDHKQNIILLGNSVGQTIPSP